jgi:hypothetical protein
VAARALVLSAVSCRGLIEKDALRPGAESLRQEVVAWLDRIGAAEELEPSEIVLLTTPLGKLDSKAAMDAGWRSEGMVALAWVLGNAKLPLVHVECEPSDIANGIGFLEDRANTPLHCPRLCEMAEIEAWADTYLALHWRLRKHSSEAESMDFVKYASTCKWGNLRLDHLEILDSDLAIGEVRIDNVDESVFRETLSIAQERHQAFNWLLGWDPLYSQVTTDT